MDSSTSESKISLFNHARYYTYLDKSTSDLTSMMVKKSENFTQKSRSLVSLEGKEKRRSGNTGVGLHTATTGWSWAEAASLGGLNLLPSATALTTCWTQSTSPRMAPARLLSVFKRAWLVAHMDQERVLKIPSTHSTQSSWRRGLAGYKRRSWVGEALASTNLHSAPGCVNNRYQIWAKWFYYPRK